MEAALRMEQIYKAFPGVIAVNKVDIEVNPGEVVALYNYMSQILVELIKLAG